MSKLLQKELQRRLAQAQKAAEAPKFDLQQFCFPAQRAFLEDTSRFATAVCSRRAGKCLKENTLVLTTKGAVKIQDIKVGDTVFGYNIDGSITHTKVTAVIDQGIKQVVDVRRGKNTVVSSTIDHPWVLEKNNELLLAPLKHVTDFGRTFLKRKFTNIFGGKVQVDEAYALGALLGDGCSLEGGIVISSADESVVQKTAKSLKASYRKFNANNYSWSIKGRDKKTIKYYEHWLHNKYAHEKTADFATIATWTRFSQLEFLAGLIDTDGSCSVHANRLQFRFCMQSKVVVQVVQNLLMCLFQAEANTYLDNREKYKNGPVWCLALKNNFDALRVLKELSPHMACERKKFKPEYESLFTQNQKADAYGLKNISEPYLAQCWDLTVDNESHLYLLANGTITHNTVGIAADMIDTCLKEQSVICLYVTLTAANARSILWADLKRIISDYELDVKTDETRLTVKFNRTKSEIRLGGSKDEAEIEKYRGWKLRKVYIDEAQSYRPYLKYFIDDILLPALRDLRGTLRITGTPGPILAGPFYEYTTNGLMSHHHWTAFDNPHMHNPPERDLNITLAEERAMKGISETDPGYIRETFGVWKDDPNSVVFKFSAAKNVYSSLPSDLVYIFGVDIGWSDSDAIAVLGYSMSENRTYLVHEFIKNKQTIGELVEVLEKLEAQYKPVKMVMDAGALGKKIQEEILQRYSMNLEAAEKHRKLEFIELLNDDLRTGRFQSFKGSRFQQDCALVQWDKSNPAKLQISDSYHSDSCDSTLYAWRECKHFIENNQQHKKPLPTDKSYGDYLEQQAVEAFERSQTDDWGADQDDIDALNE